ncbi:MAG: AAA family ATPase [Pyrobaculum sp.]|jgi:exonuclease SbcC
MWRLERIELDNFRSYRGRHVVEFGGVNVVWGRIGAGKTSLLYAVEFALFGRQLEVKERVAKLVDLINTESHEMGVVLTLTRGGDVLRVERRLTRRGGEKVVLRFSGLELRGREAEEKLAELLNADEDIYERLVYISHRSLEGFIYGTTQKRAVSVDRLFGIDVVDGVVKAAASLEKALLERAEELRRRLSAYEKHRDVIRRYGGYGAVASRLDAVGNEIKMLREREERLAKEAEELAKRRAAYLTKLKEGEDLLMEYYRAKSELELLESAAGGEEVDASTLEKIRNAMREALEEYEHVVDPRLAERLGSASDLETLSAAMAEAYDALLKLYKDVESQISDTKKIYDAYVAKVKKIEEEIGDAEAKLRRLEKQYIRFRELQKTFRSLEAARAALAEHRRRLAEAEKAVSFSSALRTVALYVAETGLERCPICGGPVSRETAADAAKEVEAKFGDLIREVEALREKARELERAVEEMEALSSDVAEYLAAKTRLEELQLEREEAVKRALQAEKALRQLEKKAERLRLLLARIDRRTISDAVSKYARGIKMRELRRRLRELEAELKNAGLTDEALAAEIRWREVVEELEKTSSRLAELYREKAALEEVVREVGGDADVLKKELDNVLYAYSRLQELKAKLELVKINARARLLEVARNRFNEIFLSLYKYGDIVRVNADLEQRRGYYEFYAVTPAGDKYGISKLSDGQRLSIALALALTLREIAHTNLGFVIFDEPIPYVDANIRKAFVELVKTLAGQHQIVVATQARDFANALKEAIPDAKLLVVTKRESSEVKVE